MDGENVLSGSRKDDQAALSVDDYPPSYATLELSADIL